MPADAVEVLHDDRRCHVAQLLGQHRDRPTGEWRRGVRYPVDVGMHYQRVVRGAATMADVSRSAGTALVLHCGGFRPLISVPA